jgi:hypothetical protein
MKFGNCHLISLSPIFRIVSRNSGVVVMTDDNSVCRRLSN